ncbi:hypothetical protein BDB01DRAFT_809654 [Pilobolus umbonatus]|nr:hypothetical protein BDB01DRAFT_809654 [Pilobolus umbonatus]
MEQNKPKDPYAGQYILPPPPIESYNSDPYSYHQTSYTDPARHPMQQDTDYAPPVIPQPDQPYDLPQHSYYQQTSYHDTTNIPLREEDNQYSQYNQYDYPDPHSQSLIGYLREERDNKNASMTTPLAMGTQPTTHPRPYYANEPKPSYYSNEQPQSYYSSESPQPLFPVSNSQPYYPQDQSYFPQESHKPAPKMTEYTRYEDTNTPAAPMLGSPKPTSPKVKKQNHHYVPHMAHPTPAPYHEAEGYKVQQPYKEESGCNCCCYNPAMTCCSCFCFIIALGFAAAGIAMIIVSKVIRDQCTNKCLEAVNQVQDACIATCNSVVYNVLFYGGIGVAGLAGIAVIWKLIAWTCAGCSKH